MQACYGLSGRLCLYSKLEVFDHLAPQTAAMCLFIISVPDGTHNGVFFSIFGYSACCCLLGCFIVPLLLFDDTVELINGSVVADE